MDSQHAERIAVFRYGVIRHLVSRPLAPGEKEQILAQIARQQWTIPGTSRRHVGRTTARDWLSLYELHGFDGLKPTPRADAGSSRTIPEPIQEQLLELRRERPKASIKSLIRPAHPLMRSEPGR